MPVPFQATREFALEADAADVLAEFKQQFHFPKKNGRDVIYFCGNSLGLQPRNVEQAIQTELTSWREEAVGGYFGGRHPWLYYQEYLKPSLARIVGCLETEVTVMNTLTVNLHLLMLSFYRPTPERYKILMEAGAFPSDQYAVETLVKHYGLEPETAILEIAPREGEKTLRTEDIIATIEAQGSSLAMVLFGGINYYTGQLFDLQRITRAAHQVNAIAGFDLAHVVGNTPLLLHEWEVDFAAWCSYKYLNGGPGAIGGVYVHERFATNPQTPRLGGWWGNDEKERFKMEKGFVPKTNASGWNISTAQVFNTVSLKAALELFDKAGMERLRAKSLQLTAYLEYLLHQLPNLAFEIITPADAAERGAQLSLYFKERGKEIHNKMIESGIIVDYREPGVIRVAPAPMYVSFSDVYRFYEILRDHF
ncbi:MAG: kynureninase [Chitinophagaceae bacterium]|nr:kynureninase [Chitinophagaceae bacterium]MCA6457251.1 kynureninase [Chitinophagaceae bacterium]MCA6457618.1 kynureninase [Chitinophagaceae bacterium]MCA6463331.1 kynureninase [Chitinophagaceae bacterium]